MAEQTHHSRDWNAGDFERYHAGEMPAQERHDLEKAALEDPFLADALEGYAYTPTPVNDVEGLKARMKENQKARSLVWYKSQAVARFSKIAAVMIMFLGLAWLLKINMTGDEPKEIAKVTTPTSITENSADSLTRIVEDTAKASGTAMTPQKPGKPVIPPSAGAAAAISAMKDEEPADLVVVARQRDPADTTPGSTALAATKTEVQDVEKIDLFSREKAAAPPAVFNKAIEGKVSGVVIRNQNTIRGRVVDNAGNPVAFANINDRQNNTILSADQDGYFSLSNKQNAPKVKVDVNAVGFETNNIALNANTAENKVVLKESNQALSEVVVTYGAKKRSQVGNTDRAVNLAPAKDKLSLINVLPLEGWEHFNRYVKDSLLFGKSYFPDQLRDTTIHISFELDRQGLPIKVEPQNPAGDSADAAARRIVKALPPMKKIKKNKKAGILIRF